MVDPNYSTILSLMWENTILAGGERDGWVEDLNKFTIEFKQRDEATS